MTVSEWALILTAVCIGLPSAISIDWPRIAVRNATAAALVLSWALGFVAYYGLGWSFTPFQMWYIDCFVIALIFCKAHRTPWDLAVIALFPLMWYGYFSSLTPQQQWWLLWGAAVLQFIFAGLDSLFSTLRAAKARTVDTGQPPGLGFAVARAGGDG